MSGSKRRIQRGEEARDGSRKCTNQNNSGVECGSPPLTSTEYDNRTKAKCGARNSSRDTDHKPLKKEQPANRRPAGTHCTTQGNLTRAGAHGHEHGDGRQQQRKDEQQNRHSCNKHAEVVPDAYAKVAQISDGVDVHRRRLVRSDRDGNRFGDSGHHSRSEL